MNNLTSSDIALYFAVFILSLVSTPLLLFVVSKKIRIFLINLTLMKSFIQVYFPVSMTILLTLFFNLLIFNIEQFNKELFWVLFLNFLFAIFLFIISSIAQDQFIRVVYTEGLSELLRNLNGKHFIIKKFASKLFLNTIKGPDFFKKVADKEIGNLEDILNGFNNNGVKLPISLYSEFLSESIFKTPKSLKATWDTTTIVVNNYAPYSEYLKLLEKTYTNKWLKTKERIFVFKDETQFQANQDSFKKLVDLHLNDWNFKIIYYVYLNDFSTLQKTYSFIKRELIDFVIYETIFQKWIIGKNAEERIFLIDDKHFIDDTIRFYNSLIELALNKKQYIKVEG